MKYWEAVSEIMKPDMKTCYRYGMWVVEQCEVCESCPEAEDLQWNGEVKE